MFRLLKKNLTLADILLIVAVIVGVLISAKMLFPDKDDRSVHIYKDDHLLGVYPLGQDKVIKIDEHNTVKIANSKVAMLESDCPDKRCVKQGAGDVLPIICLPNHVVVEIRSNNADRKLIIR